jgi:hypothetical protein
MMVLSFILMTALPLRATIPAPPVNQIIGINDGVFFDLDEEDCRLCHENPDQYPVEDETIPNRHHLLTGTEIPDPTDAPYGTPGELFSCLTCHEVENTDGIVQFIVERDCLVCHVQTAHGVTVHHRTDEALGILPQGPDCKACHGSLVDNIEDGHFISAEPTTAQTPKPSGGNGLPLNNEGSGAGGCDYCHSTGTGDPMVPGIDPDSVVAVDNNEYTHHASSYWGSSPEEETFCHWCHDFSLPPDQQIRVCENCHGRDALHNIQVDSDGDNIITPGIELPGYGHIGDPDDCWGCHGFNFMSSSTPPEFGPIIPQINTVNYTNLTAGSDTALIITGSAFKNSAGETEYTSILTLTASDGTTVSELSPDFISETWITVTIPGTLAIGNYTLRAVKLDKQSNAVNLSVTPEVAITAIDCSKCLGTMTITGAGFSEKPEGTDEDITVMENGRPLNIISWTDEEITVSGSRCSGTVEVDSLYGSASQSQ